MNIVLLTEEQKQSLDGVEFISGSLFNPIKDINNNWIISIEEQEQCLIEWVKLLPLSEYLPKETQRPF